MENSQKLNKNSTDIPNTKRNEQEISEKVVNIADGKKGRTSLSKSKTSLKDFLGSKDKTEGIVKTSNCKSGKTVADKSSKKSIKKEVKKEKSITGLATSKIPCPFCDKSYTTVSDIKNHNIRTHLDREQCVCPKCCIHFTQFGSLVKHVLHVHIKVKYDYPIEKQEPDDSLEPATCDICSKQFKYKHYLQYHIKAMHSTNTDIYICNDCDRKFQSRKKITEHIFRHHMPPTLKCPHCPKMFRIGYDLNKHLLTHAAIIKKYVCEICGKRSKTYTLLEVHKLIHSDEKTFLCKECGKRFRTYSNLEQHLRIHSDVRPFSCDLCDKAFRIRNHLKQHMVVHNMVSTSTSRKRKTKTKTESSETSLTDDE